MRPPEPGQKPGVLMLCVANSARSQMAEGWARQLWGDHIEVQSAGSAPTTVNPYAIEVMREVGVELTGHRSKPIAEVDPSRVQWVVTLCAEEVCPAWLGAARRVHCPVADPASPVTDSTSAEPLPREEMLARFRAARDEIRRQLARVAREEGWLLAG